MLHELSSFENVQLALVIGFVVICVVPIITRYSRKSSQERSIARTAQYERELEHKVKMEELRLGAKGTALTVRQEED